MHEIRDVARISSSESSELSSFLSGNDAITLLEFIHQSLSCHTDEDFTGLFPKLQELFPFDFAHGMLGCHDEVDGIITDHCVNISFPKGWIQEYLSRNYMNSDIVVQENFTNYRLQKWSDVKKSCEIKSLCIDFGMRKGYTHGSRPSPTDKYGSMFNFSGPSMEYGIRTEVILEIVTPHLHQALSHIFSKKRPDAGKAILSAREREVLDWLKQGKSSWDISVILGISERTVNFHVYNIMKKLDVSNRPQAVAVAAHLGLVDIG
jgi:DNA-binding CsgD family transcriptional regulator